MNVLSSRIAPKQSIGEIITLVGAALILIGFFGAARQSEHTGKEMLDDVSDLPWEELSVLPFGTIFLYLVPIAAIVSSLAVLLGLVYLPGRGVAAVLALIGGLAGVLYFVSYFANRGKIDGTGIGFWLALASMAGLVAQVFVPRQTRSEQNQISQSVRFLAKIEGLPIAIVLVLLYIAFIVTAQDVFLKPRIYMSFLQTVSPPLILGLGLTFVITAGEIDLSFPAVVAFSGYVFTWCFRNFTENMNSSVAALIALGAALAAGAMCGYINGLLVARIGVPAIMATLAAQFFWYGVTVLLSDGLQSALKTIDTNSVHEVLTGRIYGVIPNPGGRGRIGIPTQALWALGLTVVLWFILNRHKFGEAVMFIGDNPNVARVMGVNVEATRIKVFTLMGTIAAFAGVILTMEMGVFYPTQGQGMLLPVMAAVFIGGTSMAGGVGVIVGTFFGSYIIGSLEAGVVATGISGFWVQLVQGLVMGTSVVLNTLMVQGQFGVLVDRLRHWSVIARPVGDRVPPDRAT